MAHSRADFSLEIYKRLMVRILVHAQYFENSCGLALVDKGDFGFAD